MFDKKIKINSYIKFTPREVNTNKTKYDKEYDIHTITYYRILRKNKINAMAPSTENIIYSPEKSFMFEYIWDPITGEKTNIKDPYGPLYFFPDELINYFYRKRLTGLWIDQTEYFSGGYDYAVGAGENLSQNEYSDKRQDYVFRLPIVNCYLLQNTNLSTITMGPKLTLEEVSNIYNLAEKYYPLNYKNMYNTKRPDLIKMYKYYINAISKTPELDCVLNKEIDDIQKIYQSHNIKYVNKLKAM